MTTNMQSILDRQVGSTPPPQPHPIGTYLFAIKDFKIDKEVGQNKVDVLVYNVVTLAAQPDVDQGQLVSLPGGISGKTQRLQFWLTEDAIYRLERFLKDVMGIEGVTTKQGLTMAVGRQFLGHVKHKPNTKDDNAPPYGEIDSTAKA